MKFAELYLLNLLWLLPVAGLFFVWTLKDRAGRMNRFAQEPLLKAMGAGFDTRRLTFKNILIMMVLGLSILALSRPQWGFEWQEIKRKGVDILIVVDTSKSMLTRDVKPNRLQRTKLAIKDLIKKLKGDRIGLIAFAGDAFFVSPLTVDYNGFLLSLNDLSVDTVPRGGTNIAAAIQEAIRAYDETPNQYKSVIIMTDGDDLQGDPLALAKKAKDKEIKIYTIGIGTKEGELIQVPDASGGINFLKDRGGNFIKSRLNEQLLQDIALTTGGLYVRASGSQFGLDVIYEKALSKLEKRDIESKVEKRYFERFQFPLMLAVILLIIETCLIPCRRNQ